MFNHHIELIGSDRPKYKSLGFINRAGTKFTMVNKLMRLCFTFIGSKLENECKLEKMKY